MLAQQADSTVLALASFSLMEECPTRLALLLPLIAPRTSCVSDLLPAPVPVDLDFFPPHTTPFGSSSRFIPRLVNYHHSCAPGGRYGGKARFCSEKVLLEVDRTVSG